MLCVLCHGCMCGVRIGDIYALSRYGCFFISFIHFVVVVACVVDDGLHFLWGQRPGEHALF